MSIEGDVPDGRLVDALATTALGGHVTGKKCFGYGIALTNPDNPKGRKIYIKVAGEAEVVQEIFNLYVSGYGYRKIADALNRQGIPSPAGGTWDISTILYIVRNWRKYMGFQSLRKVTRKVLPGGEKFVRRNPEDEWIVSEKPLHEPILSQDLVDAYIKERDRRKRLQNRDGKGGLGGRGGIKNPEVGLITCAECGANCNAHRARSRGHTYCSWECGYRRRRGESVCKNRARFPVQDLRESLLQTLERELFSPENIDLIAKLAASLVQSIQSGFEKEIGFVDRRIAETEKQIDNGTRAILRGCKGPAFEKLKSEIERMNGELQLLRAQKESILKVQAMQGTGGLEEKIRARIGDTCRLLAHGTTQMVHEELRRHIEGMELHPDGRVKVKATLAGILKGQELDLPLARSVAYTIGESGGIRTHGPRLKKPLLYR